MTIIKGRINTLLANRKAIDREIDAHGKSSETIEATADILVTTKGRWQTQCAQITSRYA